MAGHRAWKAIRGAADEDQERQRRVEMARREVESEQHVSATELVEPENASEMKEGEPTEWPHAAHRD